MASPTIDRAGERGPSAARSWWPVVAGLVVLPIVVLLVVLARRTWYPTGDLAQAELRMRSLPRHPPLVGAAGRIADDAGRQGNHPGPLMFWVTWPLYALLGRSAWAFEAATGLVNAAWLGIAVWLVRARSGSDRVTLLFGVVALLLVGAFGLDALTQPWNPWVALLPFLVLVLAAWWSVEGGRWAGPLAAAAGSYALQGHAGYAPLVLPLVAVALLALPVARLLRGRRRPAAGTTDPGEAEDPEPLGAHGDRGGEPGRAWWPAAVVAVGVALLAWSGPLADLVVDHPNNLSKLLANFGSPDEPPLGPIEAVRLLGRCTSPWGPWLTTDTTALTRSPLPGLLLLAAWAVVAVLVARTGRAGSLARLDAVVALGLLTGWFALSRVFGAPYLYLFRWTSVLTALVVFTLVWGAAVLATPWWAARRRRSIPVPLAVGAVALLALAMAVRVGGQDIPYGYSGDQAAVLAPEVADAIPHDRRYLVTWEDPTYLGGLGFGLLLDLERRGVDVGVGPEHVTAAEARRVRCAGEYDAVLVVVTGPAAIDSWRQRPGARLLAETGPPGPPGSEGDEAATLAELRQVLLAEGRDVPPARVEQLLTGLVLDPSAPPKAQALAKRLVTEGLSSAVFLEDPAPTAPPLVRSVRNEACWKD